MKSISHVIFMLAICTSLYSQADFRKGYYITANKDTVYGLIDYRGDILNSKTCSYKKDVNSETVEFSPGSIAGYRFIDDKYYVSRTLPDSTQKVVFMEYLLNGIISVYYLKTSEKERYFIEKDGKMVEMNNDEHIITNDKNEMFAKPSNQYIGVLRYYFQDAPSVAESAANTDFDKKSIINISKKYHEQVCKSQECIEYEKNIHKIIFYYGLFFETGLQKIKSTSVGKYAGISEPDLIGGLLLQANFPTVNEKIFVQLKGNYGYTNFSGIKDLQREYDIKYSFYGGSIDLLYKLSYKKVKPYFYIGYTFNYIQSADYNYHWFTDAFWYNNEAEKRMSQEFELGAGLEIYLSKNLRYIFSLGYAKGEMNMDPKSVCTVNEDLKSNASTTGYRFSTGFLF